jgi:hypothetical protein
MLGRKTPINLSKHTVLCLLGVSLLMLASSCSVGPCGFTWIWSGSSSPSPETKQVLTASEYAPAEVVYRTFLPGEQWPESRTNFIYCLSFGDIDAPVPPDFMTRFSSPVPTVITGTNGLVRRPGLVSEPKSGREVVKLTLYSLEIQGDRADARVFYVGGSEVVTETLQLEQQDGRWKVTKMKQITRSYF